MIRRHVLAAIDRGIASHDEFAARLALTKGDPIARRFARRRFERAMIDAALACDAVGLTKPTPEHLLRLSALDVVKQPTAANDVDATTAAYAKLPKVTTPGFPLYTVVTMFALLAAAGSFAFYLATRPGPKSREYHRPMPAPTATAYHDGGVPLHDTALDDVFGDKLTDLVIAGSRDANRSRVAEMRARELHHGQKLDAAWQAAIDAYGAALGGGSGDGLKEAVRELTDELGNIGQGYFLEGRMRAGAPIIQSYRVEEIVFVIAGEKLRRVLSLRRLDKLNISYAALGMHDEDADPVLHLERIDEHVASVEMPLLAQNAIYPIGEDGWMPTPEAEALGKAAGEAIRAEYVAALGAADADAAAQIAKLLAERGRIIEEWRQHLDRKNISFVATDDLFLPKDLLPALKNVVPHYQQERVEAIEAELAELEAPRIHDRVRALVAGSVRRHEAQHGYDYDRDTELRYPDALNEWVSAQDNDGNEVPAARSARNELSAYLSQIINDPATPQSALWHLGQQVFSRDRWGTGEFYAGVVIFEGLAKQLGAQVQGGRYDRTVLAKSCLVIAQTSDVKLRAAAKALWQDFYGQPPTTIVDAPPPRVATR
jgi:hypothetical protein